MVHVSAILLHGLSVRPARGIPLSAFLLFFVLAIVATALLVSVPFPLASQHIEHQAGSVIQPTFFGLHGHYTTLGPVSYSKSPVSEFQWPNVAFGAFRSWDNYEGITWPFIQRKEPGTITSLERSNNIVLVTTQEPHGLPVGAAASVQVFHAHEEFNGAFPVVEVLSPFSFTMQQVGHPFSSKGGKVAVYNWTRLDALVRFVNGVHGKDFLYVLGPTPVWAVEAVPQRIKIKSVHRPQDSQLMTLTTEEPHKQQYRRVSPQRVIVSGVVALQGAEFNGLGSLEAVTDETTLVIRTGGVKGGEGGDRGVGGFAQMYAWGAGANLEPYGDPLGPGSAMEPAAEHWGRFVKQLVRRYCDCGSASISGGYISSYEIWNEPDLMGGTADSPSSLFFLPASSPDLESSVKAIKQLSSIAYTTIKTVAPKARVISASPTSDSGLVWLKAFLQSGGARFADAIGFHTYCRACSPEEMARLAGRAMEEIRMSGMRMPLWNTEASWGGVGAGGPYGDETAASFIARAYILQAAAGVERFYYYAWDDQCWVATRLTLGPTKWPACGSHLQLEGVARAGFAYDLVARWLTGAQLRSCHGTPNGQWICTLSSKGTRAWIVWSKGTANFAVPPEWGSVRTTRLDGQTSEGERFVRISPNPVLIESQGGSLLMEPAD